MPGCATGDGTVKAGGGCVCETIDPAAKAAPGLRALCQHLTETSQCVILEVVNKQHILPRYLPANAAHCVLARCPGTLGAITRAWHLFFTWKMTGHSAGIAPASHFSWAW
ncbi:hypothetical protein KIL84_002511 [Mauremys mutica]|uniref:Uncharacterized protein n=1 Tax=Mauremys mutica TaxID=74926 RepID=A0A9D3X6H0_9SAUR|nr:hypothetical protein KIL84_002511 [Mauremys mutica]